MNHDPKDLYDPNDPKVRNTLRHELLRQTVAAEIHGMWREWAASMIDQGVIAKEYVEPLRKLFVPFHALEASAQADHLVRAERMIQEFVKWKLADGALRRGGPSKGSSV
jgi:hypothetical protein